MATGCQLFKPGCTVDDQLAIPKLWCKRRSSFWLVWCCCTMFAMLLCWCRRCLSWASSTTQSWRMRHHGIHTCTLNGLWVWAGHLVVLQCLLHHSSVSTRSSSTESSSERSATILIFRDIQGCSYQLFRLYFCVTVYSNVYRCHVVVAMAESGWTGIETSAGAER